MSMDLLPDLNLKIITTLEKNDVIQFESENIPLDYFIVYSIDKDHTIPAVLLQLWRFNGGFNHAVLNIVHNGLDVNLTTKLIEPIILTGRISKITGYRSITTKYNKKEQFLLNLEPESLTEVMDEEHQIPYSCTIETKEGSFELNLPEWTPLQMLPLDRVTVGSYVQIWEVEGNYGLIKVLKL